MGDPHLCGAGLLTASKTNSRCILAGKMGWVTPLQLEKTKSGGVLEILNLPQIYGCLSLFPQ